MPKTRIKLRHYCPHKMVNIFCLFIINLFNSSYGDWVQGNRCCQVIRSKLTKCSQTFRKIWPKSMPSTNDQQMGKLFSFRVIALLRIILEVLQYINDVLKMGQPRPLFNLFSFFQTHYNFYIKKCVKTTNQYTVPGFELTTFGTWASSHNH